MNRSEGETDLGGGEPAGGAIMRVLLAEPGASMLELAVAGGLDPRRDFVQIDMRGWPLGGEDLRGFDLTGADLRGTGIEHALRDDGTILDGVRLDRRAARMLNLSVTGRSPPPKPGAYTKVIIPDLSDAELLERDFVIRDPRSLDGLTASAPPTDQWITYEGRYDVGDAVKCSFGHAHKKGYAFRDESGRRYLVGRLCGATHLGLGEWKEFTKQRELLEDRAAYLKAIRDLKAVFAKHREWIARLYAEPAVKAFDRARDLLGARCPELVRAVRDASYRNGGHLTLPARERDFQAEERARERAANQSPPAQPPVLFRTVTRDAGELRGRVVFTSAQPLGLQLSQLAAIIDAFLANDPSTRRRDLVDTTLKARLVVERILAALDATRDFETLFASDNLELLVRWANERRWDDHAYELEDGGIKIIPTDAPVFDISRPIAPPPDEVRMADLAKASTGWQRHAGRKSKGSLRGR